jgi:hypothetical protein
MTLDEKQWKDKFLNNCVCVMSIQSFKPRNKEGDGGREGMEKDQHTCLYKTHIWIGVLEVKSKCTDNLMNIALIYMH